MAPKTSRRSSSSRRVQYSLFTGYVLASAGALLGAVLLFFSLTGRETFDGPRTVATDAVAPVGEAAASARTESQGFFESIAGYFRAGSQNAELKREVELARIRLAEAEAVKQENARLRNLLGFSEGDAPPVTVSRLIGSTATSSRRFGYIGAGRDEGVAVGMPVRSPRGVVGRVLEVGSSTSRILLITDSQSVIPVRLASEDRDVVAFAEGRGDGRVNIRLINLGINPLEVGDILVTSGTGGYYQPGIAVAIVDEVTGDGALARPVSDPAATGYVAVEPVWQQETVEAARTPANEPFEE
ncbi:rod shape-determining protein MreC [Erythrobacter sp. HKB08]|uniref:rod shape-determining protein MreC n=1 Tax=Erythrobacter sp. HKB08 TaxID=2502843 RepID=UPI001008B196|nr:rod shape-determining protein MreC [Erythrobacter sp. HKB08]